MKAYFTMAVISGALVISGTRAQAPAAQDKGLVAVVKKLEGTSDEVIVETPDSSNPTIKLDAKYPQGTRIICADASVVVSIEGDVNGVAIKNSLMVVKHDTEIKVDRCLVQDESVITRLKLKSGEVRVKVTDERVDYSTDMKVATPNATASVKGTDVHSLGYNANKGTSMVVASGSISAARADGTVRNVGGGAGLTDSADSILDAALANAAKSSTPIGMSAFEVAAGQLTVGGADRPASDLNNASTNPNASRAVEGSQKTAEAQGNDGPPPQQIGHGNRR